MSEAGARRLGRGGRWTLALVGASLLAVVAAANAHLVYVATSSQPACVPHLKAPDGSGTTLRAAKSSC